MRAGPLASPTLSGTYLRGCRLSDGATNAGILRQSPSTRRIYVAPAERWIERLHTATLSAPMSAQCTAGLCFVGAESRTSEFGR